MSKAYVGSNQYVTRGDSAQASRADTSVVAAAVEVEDVAFAFTDNSAEWQSYGFDHAGYSKWSGVGITDAETAADFRDNEFAPGESTEWAAFAFPAADARKWVEIEVTSAAVADIWMSADFDLIQVPGWMDRQFSAQEAVDFMLAGIFDPESASDWREQGFTAEQARPWEEADGPFHPYAAAGWRDAGFDVDSASLWRASGAAVGEAQGWVDVDVDYPDYADSFSVIGLTYETVGEWFDAGFIDPDEMRPWVSTWGGTPAEAGQWANVCAPGEANDWVASGFSAEDAEEWSEYAPSEAAERRDQGLGPEDENED